MSGLRRSARGSLALAVGIMLSCVAPAAADPPAPAGPFLVKIDNGGTGITPGAEITYKAVVSNHGPHDVADGKVVLSFDESFTAAAAAGSRLTRPNVVVWQAVLPAGRDAVFTVTGRYGPAVARTRSARATGCAFAAKAVQPLACNTDVDQVAQAPVSPGGSWWLVAGVIAVSGGLLLGMLVLAHRRRSPQRRDTFGGIQADDHNRQPVLKS